MRPTASNQPDGRRYSTRWESFLCCALLVILAVGTTLLGQDGAVAVNVTQSEVQAPAVRARKFLSRRALDGSGSPAQAMVRARQQHSALATAPRLTSLSATWQAVGPAQVATAAYGNVTGRVSSIAIDPADATGNTVYVGTTGGGVWKSVNAAGPVGSVSFVPLTDTLQVFSANAGTGVIPSLSIGALSVGNGVVLAGTGDPNDATDSFYGSGVLRSADGGLTWTVVQGSQDGVAGAHSFTGLGFAGFAWSSTAAGMVVAAVSSAAEGDLVNAGSSTYSVKGLYVSNDAGVTWRIATLMDGSQVVQSAQSIGTPGGVAATAVVWNAMRQRFYAAVRSHGYYESPDGMTWTRLVHQPGAGLTVAACPAAVASVGCPIFRGALTVQPVTGDLFALTVDGSNRDQGLWQDVCGLSGTNCANATVLFAKQIVTTPLEVGSGSTVIPQGDYDLALAAVASGADTLVFAGTRDLYRCSVAAGCLLRNTTNALNGCAAPAKVAPAQHAIAVMATGGLPLAYVGNDGGVWRSTDGVNQQATSCSADDATHFQNLNAGLGSLAEVVSFAQHPTDAAVLLVGLGANGSAATSNAGAAAAWGQLAAGEGGGVAIDPGNPALWYVSTGAGVSVKQCAKGTACGMGDFVGATVGVAQVSGDASLVDVPWLLDPTLSAELIVGTCRVWRGQAGSGALWSDGNTISKVLAGSQSPTCVGTNGFIRSLGAGGPASGAVAAQSAGSTVLYAGMAGALDGGRSAGGHVFTMTSAGTAGGSTVWVDSAASVVTNDVGSAGKFNPGGFDVSSLAVDAHDATGRTVYATVMGFAGNGVNAPHVYRSVDAGVHWVNVSSNLPNAPANSVVVDPNDANTLYVALDTGVYVTTQVTSCATANCWSVYGAGLPNAPVVQLAVAAGMATGDGRTGELRAGTYGRGIWQIPLLTAVNPAQPAMSVNPVSLTFAVQQIATASAPQTVTVTNTGNAVLTVSQVAATGDFVATNRCVGMTVVAGSTCTVQVKFLPTATGARAGVLTVYGNVSGGQVTVALAGTGAPPAAIVPNPLLLSFAATAVGATSAAQNITISNTGGVSATVQVPVVMGDFRISANTCGSSLAAGVGCTVSVVFVPTGAGVRSGSLTVTDDAGVQVVSLTGTGTLAATDALTPGSLTFGVQQLNTTSAAQVVTLTNTGDVVLTLLAAQISSGDFAVVNGCGNSLNGHASCALGVSFVPKSVGAGVGVLSVSDQYRVQTVALNGTGVSPPGVSLSPLGGLGFGVIGVGLSGATQVVTLTNNGGLQLAVSSVGVTGDFAVSSSTCGVSVAAGTSCTMQMVFVPAAAGVRAGTLTVVDNAAGSPHTMALTGTGVDFALSANGPTSVTVSNGKAAVFPLLLSSATGVPGVVALTCTGVPAHASCVVTPGSGALGGTSTVNVTVLTGSVAQMRRATQAIWLAGLIPLGLLVRRRKALGLLVLGVLLGCGSGRLIPGDGSSTPVVPVTPTGTYGVIVTGTSAGLSRSVTLTVVVQ